MSYQLVIFDFDGTLADSFPFFLSIVNQLAERHAFRRVDAAEIPLLRGLPPRAIMAALGLPAWRLPQVARDFMARMRENTGCVPLFPGIEAALGRLAGKGVQLAIISSNAEDNVAAVLGDDLLPLISQLECGMSIFGKQKRIEKVLRRSGLAADVAIYIGDQITDLEAARAAGVAFAAVAWGYGTLASMQGHNPDKVLLEPDEIGLLA